ncbi:hypothetical protein [Fibrobacter sp.]|uniref:hypothetical protein n=1 Tax=Fibrobacter sp. TaxID=35828 RepID=UPI0038909D07
MQHASVSSSILKICQEAALFDSKDRLLNFQTKSEYQTPLMLEPGDQFYEKWRLNNSPISFDHFLSDAKTLSATQKEEVRTRFFKVIEEKNDDFGKTDLYLVLGFLKWEGNALAPVLFVPLDFDPKTKSLTLSNRTPIENIILRERLKDSYTLPTVEEATINGEFSILLYFSLFEKAIVQERSWKFTRHGLCLAFFNTDRLRLKKSLERGIDEKKLENSSFFNSLLGPDGFQIRESAFEDADVDQVFNPIDHHFLYTTDSHTTKVTVDALDDEVHAYAVQALPGTQKMKLTANIVAESVANKKSTLVVARRAVSKSSFCNHWSPMFRSFNGPERAALEPELRSMRDSLSKYYHMVNSKVKPANVRLSTILSEMSLFASTKTRFPEKIFREAAEFDFNSYQKASQLINEILHIFFEEQGAEARQIFSKIKVSSLDKELRQEIENHLQYAAKTVEQIKPLIDTFSKAGLFPTGVYISGLDEIMERIQENFDENTPTYDQWELKSNNWQAYRDSLKALPEAGDKWVRYRRQTSDIYTDAAVDENIMSIREEFAESLKATLKGLSDHYRTSRKQLLKLFKNPKSIKTDAELLDLVDTLIELQENKRAYKDTSVLGNHLLGRDWLFERSNWVELNAKITYLFDFREAHKRDPQLDLLLQILENWHDIRELQPQFKDFVKAIKNLSESIQFLSKELCIETPLESLSIDKWSDELQQWNDKWSLFDKHLTINGKCNKLAEMGCIELAANLKETNIANNELGKAFSHYWCASQIQVVTKTCPDMFAISAKDRAKKSKDYRNLLDQFCNANFRDVHELVKSDPSLLTVKFANEVYDFSKDEHFDLAIILDADCITVAEAIPLICTADKVIFIGDPHMPALEPLTRDANANVIPRHTTFYLENILAACLRTGIPTRELWFTDNYNDNNLVYFANNKFYNNSLKQFPRPNRDKSHSESLKISADKVAAVAQAAIHHAERRPGQTLGIVVFNEACIPQIESSIRSLVIENPNLGRFFEQSNPLTKFFIKTPERAVDRFRDVIFVCAEPESGISGERKLAVCSTLAKQELQVFISEAEINKQKTSKANLFWDWLLHLQKHDNISTLDSHTSESPLREPIMDALLAQNIILETCYGPNGISVGPVVVDANNSKRFLAVIEDDCTTDKFRESIEDREYIRPVHMKQLGWKILNIWTPIWFTANEDEVSHLQTTISIEQSVAPPPPDESEEEKENIFDEPQFKVTPYVVTHPKIEGTSHDKPIMELSAASIIVQLKFYVDKESPIHEELLLQRILELHHVDRAGPMLMKVLSEAVKQGFQSQKFIKTGKFFYSTKNTPAVLRDRSQRPQSERKLMYVSPEERALIPSKTDEHTIRQILGLLE